MKTVALELGNSGVRVNAINPGPIDTRMMRSLAEQMGPDAPDGVRKPHDGLVPLIVPITMFRHHVRRYDVRWLKDQYYLNPHPIELRLRNHA